MGDRWRGWAAITPGRFYYGGQIGTGALHSHHAVQLLIGEGLVLRGADGAEHEMPAALIPPNTPHAIVRCAADGLLALLDPALVGDLRRRAATDSAASWILDRPSIAHRDLPALAALADELAGSTSRAGHPALLRAAQVIERTLPGPVRLATVADAVHLSQSRLAHVFREESGLPFRPYVLWARLRLALTALSHGASLTDAAYAAGFADAPHLTRTVRRMMGDAPSVLAAGVRWVSLEPAG